MTDLRLYAIVMRLTAMHRGAVPRDHGDLARAALLDIIRRGDSPLAQTLHDENAHKPYTISLLQGDKRGADGALHFGEGDSAYWRFTLLCEPAFEALLRRYLLSRALPHTRIGMITFGITDTFASGNSHPDSGHASIVELTDRWTVDPNTLPREIVLDFRSPTAFSMGQDKESKVYRYRSLPDARLLFSSLRKRWDKLGGAAPGDEFDEWVGAQVETQPLDNLRTHTVVVERRPVTGFTGRVRFRAFGGDLHWLPFLHLLADLSFWTGAGYQPTRGMGQVRAIGLR
jgi:CRISPR-associated endoribonuclease Cas6